jgi:hypothetical protein
MYLTAGMFTPLNTIKREREETHLRYSTNFLVAKKKETTEKENIEK